MSARVLVLSTREERETADEVWIAPLKVIPRFAAMKAALLKLSTYRAIAFTSANGVESFLGALMSIGRDVRSLYGVKLAAVGAATARSLEAHQLRADLVANGGSAELAEEMVRQEIVGPVLFPRAAGGREELVDALKSANIAVDVVEAYETVVDQPAITRALDAHAAAPFAAVAFASPKTVEAVVKALDLRPEKRALFDGVRLGAVGDTTRDALTALGFSVAFIPETPDLNALVDGLKAK